MKRFLIYLLIILPAIVLFVIIADNLNFTQDDAYISYRFATNYLNGDGLVYNAEERVEGFTNFGWVIYLILWGSLGANFIVVSKISGLIFGAGIIILTFTIALNIVGKNNWMHALLPSYLIGVNPSLAYWSPAGLETAAFGFFVMLSFYFYLKRNPLLISSLLIAVWIRPEGALVAALFILVELIAGKRRLYYVALCIVIAFFLSVPFIFFKLFYYGSIFPNPFYAKTALIANQFKDGLTYSKLFFIDYGFYGAGLIIPLVFFRKLTYKTKICLYFFLLYLIYIIAIGGDFLKVHRFYIPVMGLYAILITVSLSLILKNIAQKWRYILMIMISVSLLFLTYYLPIESIKLINMYEKGFTNKMAHLAESIKASDDTKFSAALPTIGIFAYKLIGHRVIDMVGLTDSTIARHSEIPIPGMKLTWKEKKHNSMYILSNEPDYIVFSTEMKPSAPAERALMVYRQFIDSYRVIGWEYKHPIYAPNGTIVTAFKKVRPIIGEIEPYYPIEYVEYYKAGLDASAYQNHELAVKYYMKALNISPPPYNLGLAYSMALSLKMIGRERNAKIMLGNILKQDSLSFLAHRALYMYAVDAKVDNRIELHKRWLLKIAPWYICHLDSTL